MRGRIIATVLGLSVFSSLAFAEGSGPASQALSVSGGIASPGGPTAVFQNSAGLVQNKGFGATIQGGASESFKNPYFRAGLLGGGSSYGLVGGVTQTTTDPSSTSAFYGLGVAASNAFSIGISGQTGISNAGGTSINAGALISGSLPFVLGFTAVGINDGANEFGAGISSKSGPIILVLDGAYNSKAEKIGLKPGFKAGSGDAAISMSYGFLDAKSTSQLSDGFTAGVSFKLGSPTLQLYYNEFAEFYGALTFGL